MSEGPVDEQSVRHVAELAHVELEEDELATFTEQFAEILTWFEALDDVPEVEAEGDVTNVLRPDEVRPSLEQGEALSNATATEDGYFRGPPVG